MRHTADYGAASSDYVEAASSYAKASEDRSSDGPTPAYAEAASDGRACPCECISKPLMRFFWFEVPTKKSVGFSDESLKRNVESVADIGPCQKNTSFGIHWALTLLL
jgi:hypothetical protein